MTAEDDGAARVRVVIADDSIDLRTILRRLLQHDGRFEVVGEAQDGEEVVAVVKEHQPDVVLLDLSMPVVDGKTAIPHVRDAAPDAMVIVLSGFGSYDVGDPAELGADAFIEKGAGIDAIVRTLAEVAGLGA